MTAMMELVQDVNVAVKAAEKEFNARTAAASSELYAKRERVHKLTRDGLSANEIADAVGMSQRNVVRHRSAPLPDNVIQLPTPQREITDERATELEQAAGIVLDLACRLRDENPCLVSDALLRLSHWDLHELAIIAIAAIDIDSTKAELFAWVTDLPAAREQSHE